MDSCLPLYWNALHVYAAQGDSEAVQCLLGGTMSTRPDIREMTLVRRRFPPDVPGHYGDTALHLAAANGHVSVVELLLEHRADHSIQNQYGQTPLFFASAHGHADVASCLIVAGADMHRKTNDGLNSLDVAANSECRFLFRALEVAEDEEEVAKKKATQERLKLVLLCWSKAGMVNGFRTWRAFALLPQSQVGRLLEDMNAYAAARLYDDCQGT